MKNSIFLDTCIFFELHENSGTYHSFTHLNNKGYTLCSSLTVIGELIQQLAPLEEKNEYLNTFWSFIADIDLILLIPNSGVSYACYLICKHTDDGRMKAEYTDLVHLAYATAYEVPFFITTDKHLSHYRIPQHLLDRGFQQTKIMNLSSMETQLLNKKG